MIEEGRGDLLRADVDALVNAVNTGLELGDVRPLIERAGERMGDVRVVVFAPGRSTSDWGVPKLAGA